MLRKKNIFVPHNLNFLIFLKNKHSYIYIYNKTFYFTFFLEKNFFFFEKTSNYIIIYKNNKLLKQLKIRVLEKKILQFLTCLLIYYKIKIKFKGKGLKITKYKKIKGLKFFFGKSHLNLLLYNKILLKKIRKYKFILMSTNHKLLKLVSKRIILIKPLNCYTKRGLRNSKEIWYKRISRKTSYK
jgi:hypothetical protein